MNYCQKKVNKGRDCVIKEKINEERMETFQMKNQCSLQAD